MKQLLTIGFADPEIPEREYVCKTAREIVKIIKYWMRTVDDRVKWCIKRLDEEV
jgi:hypothetical protein